MNGPEIVLSLSRRTMEWVKEGGKPTRTDWRSRFQLSWQSFWFERNLSLSRDLPIESGALRSDPVFILGLWRSGTTFLHNLLGTFPALICPTTWQCMHPSLHRLHPAPPPNTALKRPMDGLMVDASSPQEDEFALLMLGVPTVYRGFLDPRRLPELSQWLNPDNWSNVEPAGWLETWKAFLGSVMVNKPGRLLLKSPNHSFRIQALMNVFPNASYVWLVRDPVEAWHSNYKMWRSMCRTYGLWHCDEAVLDAFLRDAFHYAGECLSTVAARLPTDRLAVLDFAHLAADPVESVQTLNNRLGLADWSEIAKLVAGQAKQSEGYRPETYGDHQLSSAAQIVTEDLHRRQTEALLTHGIDFRNLEPS
jgi:hypothetical protein